MPDSKTKTYVLDGKTYTVPADTSMDELDQYIRGQSASGPRPIQDTSTISARPSLGARAWSAFRTGGPTALGQELGESTRNAIGNVPLPGVNKTLGEGLTDLGRMTDMASTEASLLQAPQLGESIVNMARGGAPLLGNKAASLLRKPATSLQSMRGEPGAVREILPSGLQKWTVPPWMIPKGELGTPTNPGPFGDIPVNAPKPPIDPTSAAVKQGIASRIPSRLPPNLRGDPFSTEPAPQPGGGSGGVNVYPEPREPMPGDRPGAAWSQGRESTLPSSAARGAPGAVDVLRNIGKPIVLTPRSGVGYPSPGEFEAVREPLLGRSSLFEGPQAPSTPAQSPGTQPAPQPHRFSNSARTRQQILDLANEQPAEEGGETGLDAILRGAPGVNPSYRSLLKNLQKTRKEPLF